MAGYFIPAEPPLVEVVVVTALLPAALQHHHADWRVNPPKGQYQGNTEQHQYQQTAPKQSRKSALFSHYLFHK
jgi:hypothetical protein